MTYSIAPHISQRITLADIQTAGLASSQGSPSYSVTGVGTPVSGTAIFNANNILYTYPASGSPTSDSFTYTVTDGTVSLTATVSLTFVNQSGTPSGSITVSGAAAGVTLYGIPGLWYDVQRSPDLSTWTLNPVSISPTPPIPAAGDGKISFTDSAAPSPSGYYRTIQH